MTGFHPHRTRCVRTETWSYLRHPEERIDELYNIVEDPLEQNNRIRENQTVAEQLRSLIGQRFEPSASGPFVKDFPTVMARHGGTVRQEPDDAVRERLEKLGYY